MNTQPVILIEFNELCPHLLDRWIDSGDLPNFRRLRDTCSVFVTEADELAEPNLEPWIQWYSLHTGVSFKEHGVFRLSEGAKSPHASVWDLLIAQGMDVMDFASMNCRAFRKPGSIFLPDPWDDNGAAYPEDLEPFRRFTTRAIQEHSNATWSVQEILSVGRFLLGHGLRAKTAYAAANQLVSERLTRRPMRWRRVRVLDNIMFDVFRHYYVKARPQFATFFSNSTAHLQHAYWRYMEPERFTEPVTAAERNAYGAAVKFGYECMDRLLADLLALAEAVGARIMFATALSQQAYTAYEGRGGRHYYRPNNAAQLLETLGVSFEAIQPIMAHQYILTFRTEDEKVAAKQKLMAPTLNDRQLFDVQDGNPPRTIVFGSQIYSPLGRDERLDLLLDERPAKVRFFDFFYQLESTQSGRHHPDGCFWIQSRAPSRVSNKVSLLDIAPTILEHFGIPATTMAGRPLGVS